MLNSAAMRAGIMSPQIHAGRRILNAIRSLKNPDGSSVSEIKKWLSSRQQLLESEELTTYIKVALKNGALEKNGRKYKIVEKERRKAAGDTLKQAGNVKNKPSPKKRKLLEKNVANAAFAKEGKKVDEGAKHLKRSDDKREVDNKLHPEKRKRLETSHSNVNMEKLNNKLAGEIPKRPKRAKEKRDAKNKMSPKRRRRLDPAKVDDAGDNSDLPENVLPSGDSTTQSSNEKGDSQFQESSGSIEQRHSRDPVEDVFI